MLGLKKIDRSDRQVTFTMPEENQSLPSSWNWVD
jgi:hypothetical protein